MAVKTSKLKFSTDDLNDIDDPKGHRCCYFKCKNCGLEFQVRTWRSGPDVHKHFGACPECGEAGRNVCLLVEQDDEMIFSAMSGGPKTRAANAALITKSKEKLAGEQASSPV